MASSLHVHADHVEAVMTGPFDLAECKKCVDEAQKLCEENQFSKLLVNGLAMTTGVSVASRFSLGEYLASSPAARLRVAIVTTTALVRVSKALENTANNRGAQVMTTDSMEQARTFLGLGVT